MKIEEIYDIGVDENACNKAICQVLKTTFAISMCKWCGMNEGDGERNRARQPKLTRSEL